MKHILTFGLLLAGIGVFGQEYVFDIHNTSLDEYIRLEENLGSEKIPNIRNHVSFNGDAQPIKFKREQKIISDLVVYYYFKEKDSSMSYILYEWDESLLNLKANKNDKKSEEYQKALIKKHNDLEKIISDTYGVPQTEGNLSDLKQTNEKGGLKKKSKWFPNDSTEIEMYTSLSNYYEKRGVVTITPTHRIRLYVRNSNKEKKITPNLTEKRLDTLKTLSDEFIQTLGQNDLGESKEYLSELILNTVTDEQLNSIIENIDFERETELIYSGVQTGSNESVFAILQYKYKDSNPPNELIKIIFDDKNKVVGIQPIKLQGKVTD